MICVYVQIYFWDIKEAVQLIQKLSAFRLLNYHSIINLKSPKDLFVDPDLPFMTFETSVTIQHSLKNLAAKNKQKRNAKQTILMAEFHQKSLLTNFNN